MITTNLLKTATTATPAKTNTRMNSEYKNVVRYLRDVRDFNCTQVHKFFRENLIDISYTAIYHVFILQGIRFRK